VVVPHALAENAVAGKDGHVTHNACDSGPPEHTPLEMRPTPLFVPVSVPLPLGVSTVIDPLPTGVC
jgi:hypothetical protein